LQGAANRRTCSDGIAFVPVEAAECKVPVPIPFIEFEPIEQRVLGFVVAPLPPIDLAQEEQRLGVV